MKVAMHPELFPCSKFNRLDLPRADVTKIIFCNIEGQGYISYIPTYVAQEYKLPTP